MIQRYVGFRLRRSAEELIRGRKIWSMAQGTPGGSYADRTLARARRRYDRWRMVWTVLYGWDE